MAIGSIPSSSSLLNTGIQGIQSGLGRANQAAGEIARNGTTEQDSDLASSMVDLKSSELQVKASAKVVKAADDMIGTLIDIKA